MQGNGVVCLTMIVPNHYLCWGPTVQGGIYTDSIDALHTQLGIPFKIYIHIHELNMFHCPQITSPCYCKTLHEELLNIGYPPLIPQSIWHVLQTYTISQVAKVGDMFADGGSRDRELNSALMFCNHMRLWGIWWGDIYAPLNIFSSLFVDIKLLWHFF